MTYATETLPTEGPLDQRVVQQPTTEARPVKYLVIDRTMTRPIRGVVERGGKSVGTTQMLDWRELKDYAKWLGLAGGRGPVTPSMELVLIRGLPGSGKTTMARVLALVGYEHHEADHYFERGGAYKFDPAELPKAHAWCLERANDSMARGARCVVANTFTRRWEMQPYMDAAKAAGVPVRVIEARGEWANCHGVPADAIERMRARWELVDA